MAHQVETMMYVGETPWHRLGVKLDSPPTTREAMMQAGLDWEVGLKNLVTVDGEPVTHRATFRKSDGRVLGVVGPSYCPIQNATAFEWFDPFLDAKEATIETAGSLREGRNIWVLAKLNRAPSVIVPGDEVEKYVLLANSHDGTLAGRVGFTPIRVVCANTLSMAIDDNASKLLRVRHTKNAKDVLESIRDIMNVANASFEATAEQYRALARKHVNGDDLEKYVNLVFTRSTTKARAVKAAESAQSSVATMVDEILSDDNLDKRDREPRMLETITELFENGTGNTLPGVRGTWWAAYNAVTEFTTHHRGKTDETRMQAAFNDGALLNRKALTAALALAA